MGKSGELIKNTAIISIGKMGTQVVNFLLLPLYTAKLTTEAYGNFDYVTTIALFLVPLMTMLMFFITSIYFLYAKQRSKNW